ncbi:MAG: hypothetical protein K6E91_07220 [Butyrivibrio sp.]|nr:hypothetical protein [Butyrivibrio sp.]
MSDYIDDLKKMEKKKADALDATKSADVMEETLSKVTLPQKEQTRTRKQSFHTSAYRQILEHNFQSQAWINESEKNRKHRKNINANYKAVTGRKWTGLGSEEKNNRKKEFESRRMLSLKASEQVAEFLLNLGKETTELSGEEALTEEVFGMNLGKFEYAKVQTGDSALAADEAFIDSFKSNMPMLHRASLLYEKLLQEDFYLEGQNERSQKLLERLAFMSKVRQAYEDRIRIIASPYYVSMREKDFADGAPESLEKISKKKNKPMPLRTYAVSVLRWRNEEISLLQSDENTRQQRSRMLLENDIEARRAVKEFASDRTVEGVIAKAGVNLINSVLNEKSEWEGSAMTVKPVRDWVYSDVSKKYSKEDMLERVNEMKLALKSEIDIISQDSEKYRHDMEEKKNVDYEKLKKSNPDTVYKTVSAEDVEFYKGKLKASMAHLEKVYDSFKNGKISMDTMKLFLDRGLQHNLRMGKKIYDSIVLQKYFPGRETDSAYKSAIKTMIHDHFFSMEEGVVTGQDQSVTYIREQDEGKVDSAKALNKKMKKYPKDIELLPSDNDFIHIIGGKANPKNVVSRAYISAKAKNKSEAAGLFMKTLRELNYENEVYFKLSSKASSGGYFGMDDITVFFTGNVTEKMKKEILDTFYEQCNRDGKNILEAKDMCMTGIKYKDGIAFAPEPHVAETLNNMFSKDGKYVETERLRRAKGNDKKVGANFSYNTFVTSMFCQSAILANYRMGKKVSSNINIADSETKSFVKKIFREMCFLNGINPENLSIPRLR